MIIPTPALYQKAFVHYLRYGTPMDIFFKAIATVQHQMPYYVWRTQGDDKVRASHAVNNGKVFSWNNPPPTGNPGEDYGCRCWAEPYQPNLSEYAYQTLTSAADDAPVKWRAQDFVAHALDDGGDVTLQQIGQLHDIINHYAYALGVFESVNGQVIRDARKVGDGPLSYSFSNSYDFRPVSYPHGGSVVQGLFIGHANFKDGMIKIDRLVDYSFDDIYTDPISLRQLINSTSNPAIVSETWRAITDGGGRIYKVTGRWQTALHAQVKKDAHDSKY